MFRQHRAWGRLDNRRLGLYGGLKTADGLLLQYISREEEEGGEYEDYVAGGGLAFLSWNVLGGT